jgi:putative membrane protein
MLGTVLIALVAALHVGFMYLEMVAWDRPLGRKVFRTTPEFSAASKALAANQGLYNGILVAGLVWGLWLGEAGFAVKTFFLACVIVAGIFAPPPSAGESFMCRRCRRQWRWPRCGRDGDAQRSVSLSSMRRLRVRASSVPVSSSGWNSPKPAATRRFAGTPFSIRNFTTEVARAEDSSQLSR